MIFYIAINNKITLTLLLHTFKHYHHHKINSLALVRIRLLEVNLEIYSINIITKHGSRTIYDVYNDSITDKVAKPKDVII